MVWRARRPSRPFARLAAATTILAASTAWATQIPDIPPVESCAHGQRSGRKIESGLVQLTGAYRRGQKQFRFSQFADPAPPFVNAEGGIEIYGPGDYFVRYRDWATFERGGCHESVPLTFLAPNQIPLMPTAIQPWDVRKYRVVEPGAAPYEILVGGTMTSTADHPLPIWPQDNFTRRLFLFRADSQGRWSQAERPLVGVVGDSWLGHSYGGNIIQEDAEDQQTIRLDSAKRLALFYERVSVSHDGRPTRTELFASEMPSLSRPGREASILSLAGVVPPSARRSIGGELVEGPRPIQLKVGGRTLYVVGFSSGDYPTDGYTINFLWSRSLFGPYHAFMTDDGGDFFDFAGELKARYGLTWIGRPALFRAPNGELEMLFTAAVKAMAPEIDYDHWPKDSDAAKVFRALFKAKISLSATPDGSPSLSVPLSAR